jgi:hypothetical protein
MRPLRREKSPSSSTRLDFITDGSVGNEAELIKLMVRSVNI